MWVANDLTGQKFGKLTAIERCGKSKQGAVMWLCRCDCGNYKEVRSTSLTSGTTRSCGCILRESRANRDNAKNIVGQKFKRWTIVERDEKLHDDKRNSLWVCECECGTIKTLSKKDLLRKNQYLSCGCLHSERVEKQKEETLLKNINIKEEKLALRKIEEQEKVRIKEEIQKLTLEKKLEIKLQSQQQRDLIVSKRFDMLTVIRYVDEQHLLCQCDCGNIVIRSKQGLLYQNSLTKKSCGCYKDKFSHGMYNTRFYNIWRGVKKRCYQKSRKDYQNYGARGIVMSESWKTFLNFYNDMYQSYLGHVEKFGEDQTSIDRIDVNGNYEVGNCKWATRSEQASNKRQKVS